MRQSAEGCAACREKVMIVKFQPSRAEGTVSAPRSKSMAHRLLIASALCEGENVIKAVPAAEDVLATIDCIRELGADCTVSNGTASIKGIAGRTFNSEASKLPVFRCRESASTLRLLIPVALAVCGGAVFECSGSLVGRTLSEYENISREKGFVLEHDTKCGGSVSGITVKGSLEPGDYTLQGNISSQFISGLLFALPLLNGDSRILIKEEPASYSYAEMTISVLQQFGIRVIKESRNIINIPGNQQYVPFSTEVEGDYSGAAFLEALNLFKGKVNVEGLSPDSLQGDMIFRHYFNKLRRGNALLNLEDCPDLAPILFAVASALHGAVFEGTKRLSLKESDRTATMAAELKKLGARINIYDDMVIIRPAALHPAESMLNGHNDHRVVMALSVLLAVFGGAIDGAEAVEKSFPDFFEKLTSLGVDAEIISGGHQHEHEHDI